MAEDGKVQIEMFNGTDFSWWKMQIEALVVQKDLDIVLLGVRPERVEPTDWELKDRKARAVIALALSKTVAFNIMKETTTSGLMLSLSNMYEKPPAANKVFLIRELVNTRMREGSSVTEHINKLNSILARLVSVDIKFEDEVQALLLLSSLPDSWSGTVTTISNSSGTSGFIFEGIRDLIMSEDVRRRSSNGSSSELLNVGRGRKNNRDSRSRNRKKSQSRARGDVTCWNCKEVGHFRNQCPNKKKEVNAVVDHSDDEVLICRVESSVDSWVMDSGASFHATHSSEALRNLKESDFGKVRLANDEVLDVTSMGDFVTTGTKPVQMEHKRERIWSINKKLIFGIKELRG
ncbi:putative RNA-directed DNA polymerase [Helianthus debilis subsp. tardiflorus]